MQDAALLMAFPIALPSVKAAVTIARLITARIKHIRPPRPHPDLAAMFGEKRT
jgi:hypothetical protein